MSAEQDTAMYDQPDNDKLNADAEREAEFWRAHPRGDARPDKTDIGTSTGTAALIAKAQRMSRYVQRGGPDDGTVYERLAAELKRLSEELEDAEDRRGNEYLKLEDTVAEQAAALEVAAVDLLAAKEQSVRWFFRFGGALNDIAARDATIAATLKVTDDMRSGGWHIGKTVSDLGDKLYRILTSTEDAQ